MKTEQERKVDVNSILQDIDNRIGADGTAIPDDVQTIANSLLKCSMKDLIPDSYVIDGKITPIDKKKGNKKTMYQIFTSGYGLQNIKRAGNRLVRLSVNLFLE